MLTTGAVRISVQFYMTAEIAILNIEEALDSVPASGKHLPDQTLMSGVVAGVAARGENNGEHANV